MAHKVVNDSVAYLRSLAELRGRNVDFAERAVRDAATLTASQALSQKVIEIVAGDITTLLREADGREVRVRGRTVELATAGRAVTRFEPDWRIRSEEHTSELQSLMRISYAVFCLKKKKTY